MTDKTENKTPVNGEQIDLEDQIKQLEEQVEQLALEQEPTQEEFEASAKAQADEQEMAKLARKKNQLSEALRCINELNFHLENYKCRITDVDFFLDMYAQNLKHFNKRHKELSKK